MTVKEVRAMLAEFNDDAEVCHYYYGDDGALHLTAIVHVSEAPSGEIVLEDAV